MIRIENDGPRLVSSDYWQTEHARRGLVYVSVNARAFRVLVPDSVVRVLSDLRGADHVVVTRGRLAGRDALEILFEDGSDSPLVLHVDIRQVDRVPRQADHGRTDLRCLVYSEGPTLLADLPARYRRGGELPDLSAWE